MEKRMGNIWETGEIETESEIERARQEGMDRRSRQEEGVRTLKVDGNHY